jgi:hypothetical protein
MRRYLFAALLSAGLIAALPASSVARSHRVERDHNGQPHHERAHTERFGARHRGTAAHPSVQDAGKVTSLQGHILTITLTDGTTVSGTVTPKTEVECRGMNDQFARQDRSRGASGRGGVNGGPRGDDGDRGDRGDVADRGDDRGDDVDRGDAGDRGDDNGNQNCSIALSTPGTAVSSAALRVSGVGSVWEKVELDS